MARFFLCLFLVPFVVAGVSAQGSAGSVASVETQYIVEMPTAGVIARGEYAVRLFAFGSNGVLAECSAGLLTGLNVGISFGGTQVLGTGNPEWQSLPGFHARFRPFDETRSFPAVTLGFSTQGRGVFHTETEEFQVQSPGVFLALSKSFRWLGTIAWHGGVGYSFEPQPDKRTVNAYIGFEKSIGEPLSLHIEYNAALATDMVEQGGLLNASVRCSPGRGFTVEFQVLDLLKNYRNASGISRTLAVEYIGRL